MSASVAARSAAVTFLRYERERGVQAARTRAQREAMAHRTERLQQINQSRPNLPSNRHALEPTFQLGFRATRSLPLGSRILEDSKI